MPTRKKPKAPARKKTKPVKLGNTWEEFPELPHLSGRALVVLSRRRRHRAVRYGLFRLQNAVVQEKDPSIECADLPAGFADYWWDQKPKYAMKPSPTGGMVQTEVEEHRMRAVKDNGGYATFAILWDVDADLNVYLRHNSIWQEWNLTLQRVVPVLGEE